MTETPVSGRFRASDGLILIGATVLIVSLLRLAEGAGLFRRRTDLAVMAGDGFVQPLYPTGGVILGVLSLAVLVLSMRKPRPPIRELLRGPGVLACALVAIGAVPTLLDFLVNWRVTTQGRKPSVEWWLFQRPMMGWLNWNATMILGAWLALWLAGEGRSGSGWVDRLGFLVGLCWVIIYLILILQFDIHVLFV